MKFQIATKQPLFMHYNTDGFIFKNEEELNTYDNYLFKDSKEIEGGVTDYTSWNKVNIILKYNKDLWYQLSKYNYIKLSIDGVLIKQYYFITNYNIIQKEKIELECELDVWMTYQLQIKFKENSSIYIDRLSDNRWKDLNAIEINNKKYLIPNWSISSFLWQPETKLQNMDNKVNEKVLDLLLDSTPESQAFMKKYNPFIPGQFIYFIMKYNDNQTEKESYYRPYLEDESDLIPTVQGNPMPFWIIPLPTPDPSSPYINRPNIQEIYSKLIISPFLHSIVYSNIPWFTALEFSNQDYSKARYNPLVKISDWNKTFVVDKLPNDIINDELINKLQAFRADLIHSFLMQENYNDTYHCQFNELLYATEFLNECGFLKDKDKFNPINEPKLFMYPYFQLDLIRGKRNPLIIHNERLFSDKNKENLLNDIKFKINQIFTPYSITSFHTVNSGLYNTSNFDYKYSLNVSGSNTLVSLSSNFLQFLNQHLSAYNTGLYGAKINAGLSIGKGAISTIAGGIGGAVGGFVAGGANGGAFGPIGAIAGGILGGTTSGLSAGKDAFNNEIALQQQKNQLIDLARQPDTVNTNIDIDTYTDIKLLNNGFKSSIRLSKLTEYNQRQVAYFFHKFGYIINENRIVNKWNDLIIRDTWNYIQVEKISQCFDLENSNIPWQALLEIDKMFNNGFRLWNSFDYENENKIYNYDLPNWEIGIIWNINKLISKSDNKLLNMSIEIDPNETCQDKFISKSDNDLLNESITITIEGE